MKTKLRLFKNVSYIFNPAYRKWTFNVNSSSDTLLQECPGGAKTADKIVKHVAASWNRSGILKDGLATVAIRKITHPVSE